MRGGFTNYFAYEINQENQSRCYQSLQVYDLNIDGFHDLIFLDEQLSHIHIIFGKNSD